MPASADAVLFAARHSLFWLAAGNLAGLWIGLLLLVPGLNAISGEIGYGRIVPLHLNFQLYGWTSLPLVAWLFHLFRSNHDLPARAAVLLWSIALGIGGISWLAGESSGKVFLEWQGFPLNLFALSLLFLWGVLAFRLWKNRPQSRVELLLKTAGLLGLLCVVPIWHWAASPSVYPAVNPKTSGPTAASLLGSTLIVVLLLLTAAPLLGRTKPNRAPRFLCWILFGAELLIFGFSDKGNAVHHSTGQIALLGLLLVWAPLLPAYFGSFHFPLSSLPWLRASLAWFGLLAITGWISFLPRVLDHWKFTDALVAHSHLAMAGFITAFNLFLLSALGAIKTNPATFLLWNGSTFLYVIFMWIAGTYEAVDPGFTIISNPARTALYIDRAACGTVMLHCSIRWWLDSLRKQAPNVNGVPSCIREEIALAA